jgi:hypothetical protein
MIQTLLEVTTKPNGWQALINVAHIEAIIEQNSGCEIILSNRNHVVQVAEDYKVLKERLSA